MITIAIFFDTEQPDSFILKGVAHEWRVDVSSLAFDRVSMGEADGDQPGYIQRGLGGLYLATMGGVYEQIPIPMDEFLAEESEQD